MDRLATRNYNTVYLKDERGEEVCIVSRTDSFSYNVLWFDNNAHVSYPASISMKTAEIMPLVIVSYLKESEIRFESAYIYLLYHIFYIQHLLLLCRRFSQFVYNKKALMYEDRMKVLRLIRDESISSGSYMTSFTATQVVSLIFDDPRVWHHPKYRHILNYYTIVLESLAESGDLIKPPRSIEYRFSPRGYKTLDELYSEERRIAQQSRLQIGITVLTLLIFAATAVQAYVAYSALH